MSIQESGEMGKSKAREHTYFLALAWSILENGEMDIYKKEYGNTQMAAITKEASKITSQKGKESGYTKMGMWFKDNIYR